MAKIRIRSLGELNKTLATLSWWAGGVSPPPWPSDSAVTPDVGWSGTATSMTDFSEPRFRDLMRAGMMVNNPMSSVIIKSMPHINSQTIREVTGSWRGSEPAGWQWTNLRYDGDWMSTSFGPLADWNWTTIYDRFPLPFSENSLVNKAKIEALNRVEPAKSQSLVTALEAHKSINMLLKRTKVLAQAIELIKSTKHPRGVKVRLLDRMFPGKRTIRYPRKVVRWDHDGSPIVRRNGKPDIRYAHPPTMKLQKDKLSEAAQLWLEYRYGWTPLVLDIVDTLKAIHAADLRKELLPRAVRKYASGQAQQDYSVVTSQSADLQGPMTANVVANHSVEVKAYVLYSWDVPGGMVQRFNDFGAFDVPRAIWEIVPWSFVIDWFVPIGDFLGALSPKIGVTTLASGYTVRRKLSVTRTVASWASNPATGNLQWNTSPIPIGSQDSCSVDLKVRTVPLGLPTYPPTKVQLNLKRMVDAVSLLRGLR